MNILNHSIQCSAVHLHVWGVFMLLKGFLCKEALHKSTFSDLTQYVNMAQFSLSIVFFKSAAMSQGRLTHDL